MSEGAAGSAPKRLGPSKKQILQEAKNIHGEADESEAVTPAPGEEPIHTPAGKNGADGSATQTSIQTSVLAKIGLPPTNVLAQYSDGPSDDVESGFAAGEDEFKTDGEEKAHVVRHSLDSEMEAWDAVDTLRQKEIEEMSENKSTSNAGSMRADYVISYADAEAFLMQSDFKEQEKRITVHDYRNVGWMRKASITMFGKPKLRKSLKKERKSVFCIAATPCNDDLAEHGRMFQTVYRHLTGDKLQCPRIGSHWDLIGFQGTDPATDLRGAGMLGPLQLLHMLTHYRPLALKILLLSRDDSQHFPFAVVGCNITGMCIQSLREGRLYPLIKAQKGVMVVMNKLYVSVFYWFYITWKNRSCTINDFNEIRETLAEQSRVRPKKLLKFFDTHHNKSEDEGVSALEFKGLG